MFSSGTITGALSDLVKSPMIAGFGAVASTAVLVTVTYFPQLTGISDIPSVWKATIFITAIGCWSALILHTAIWCVCITGARRRKIELHTRLHQELDRLTWPELVVLAYSIRSGEPTVTLPMQSAIAANLLQRRFIGYISGPTSSLATRFRVADFVRKHLPSTIDQLLSSDPDLRKNLESEINRYIEYLKDPLYHYRDW